MVLQRSILKATQEQVQWMVDKFGKKPQVKKNQGKVLSTDEKNTLEFNRIFDSYKTSHLNELMQAENDDNDTKKDKKKKLGVIKNLCKNVSI